MAATNSEGGTVTLQSAWGQWQTDGRAFWQQMDALVETLDELTPQAPLQLSGVSASALILEERETGY